MAHQILGVPDGSTTLLFNALLRDLGVGFLLLTELRSDIEKRFEIHKLDDVVLEDLTVK